ncbi:VanW family protein [Neobacillus drentensis]|uniref:VanW family protein n=1 Tax=Neobacillus drentensis TaxID=220684 RepID=UPI001F2E9B30|nr:VanW family protein [Neobacillus drentensis]ULT56621.1 VanW family protein [Neobacillus drentensis]
MNFTWLLGLVMLSQQVNMPGELLITNNGHPISVVNRANFSTIMPELPIINPEKLKTYMDELDKQVSSVPRNAIIDHNGTIIPEQVGYRLNRELFTEKVLAYYFNKGASELEVPLQMVSPKVDSELLGNIRIEKIGQYLTYFNSNNKKRNHNIYLAAKSINNFVLFPGETFSFNQVVGERTARKGYVPATVIVKGEYAEDYGGGICQVSSTLFNAIDSAGLNVIHRYSHSKEVTYVPPKRDATVSWNGPDLIFKNQYNQPILIQAKMLRGKLKVEIYSSDVITYKPKKVPYLSY